MNVKTFTEERGLHDKDVVAAVRTEFARYDKHLHSKVKSPHLYGIRLVPQAENIIKAAFEDKPSQATGARKSDRHRLRCRVQCRLTKTRFRRLQQAMRRDGYKTMQDCLNSLIDEYLNKSKQVQNEVPNDKKTIGFR